MNALDLSRWQFGITTVYHFLFVPLTIGGGALVAGFQTAWFITKKDKYLKLTKFFGKLFLINFAMGVVTGIVQEFQFGMNWSDYSKFVGDVFGAPLAMEGLLAFFLESTFLGLWIFGWDRLPKGLHLATIWLASIGTMVSAYFILAANAFMQHPVGYEIDPETGRAVLNNIGTVLFQNTAVIAFFHTIFAAFMAAGAAFTAVAAYKLGKGHQVEIFRPVIKVGAVVMVIAGVALMVTGDMDSKIMVQQQPMKMAAAEGLYNTETGAPLSVLSIGTIDGETANCQFCIPGVLSWLATGSTDGTVQGINDLQAQYEQTYGPGWYVPTVPITYWGFRIMIAAGLISVLYGMWALWRFRRKREPGKASGKWFTAIAIGVVLAPLAGISAGWIFTEMGRQPWIVFGQMTTANGVSPDSVVSPLQVWITMIGFTLIYAALAVIEVKLLLQYVRKGAPEQVDAAPYDKSDSADADKQLYFAY